MKKFYLIWILVFLGGTFLPQSISAHDFREYWADGCCWTDYSGYCDARPDHPNPDCRDGHEAVDCGAVLWPPACWGTGCICNIGYCRPDIATGSVQELPNGIDDDCDYYVDDEQCDDIDNDGDGNVDEDIGSCLLKILFVPLDWQGNQESFNEAVEQQWRFFSRSLELSACPDNFGHRILSVATDNLPAPTCNGNCGIGDVIDDIRSQYSSLYLSDFDAIAALTDHDLCGNTAGCRNGIFTWSETEDSDEPVLAHELGHVLGLEDEYCSNLGGSTDERCNDGGIPADYDGDGIIPPADINFLGADLGCDPRDDHGCCDDCDDENYGICCEGNQTHGGRAIMSYANADSPRYFDARSTQHLKNPPNVRSETNRDGQAPMDCSFSHLGHERIVDLDYDIDEEGQMSVKRATILHGRLGLKAPGTIGRFGLQIYNYQGTVLHSSAEDIHFTYDGPVHYGVDYSTIRYDYVTRSLRAMIPDGESGPFKIMALKDGVVTSQTCLESVGTSPNGITEFVVDSTPPSITCPSNKIIECDGSRDPANTGSASATDLCDPSPAITFLDAEAAGTCPEEFTITRIWTATDADDNASSCVQTIEVVDTTPPDIQCNAPVTITPPDAPISFTATATDNCAGDQSVEIIGYDCFQFTKKGKRIDKTESCVVEVNGGTVTIVDSGGVDDNITWTVRSNDNCGNVAESTCSVMVMKK